MKTSDQTSTTKLMIRFDTQLKNLITRDLKVFKKSNRFINDYNNQVADKQLSAA